jgi:hypothetical protein
MKEGIHNEEGSPSDTTQNPKKMEGKMEKGTKHGEIKSRSDYSIIQ